MYVPGQEEADAVAALSQVSDRVMGRVGTWGDAGVKACHQRPLRTAVAVFQHF